jgi:O-antigen ligase
MLTRFRKLDLALFAAAFFVSGWDLLFTHKVGGFTLKLYQPLFLLCALVNAWPILRAGRWAELFAPLGRPFSRAMLLLCIFYLGTAPWSAFPLKSLLYSCWLLFDVFAIWLTTQRLFEREAPALLARVTFAPVVFSALVILVDYAAYPFGYRGGLIGNNQDAILNILVSRPHAFASEPSYAAVILCLGVLSVGPFFLRRARRRWLALLAVLTVLFAIVATTSRTGWACLGIGLGLLGVLPLLAGRRLPWRRLLWAIPAVPALVAIFLVTTPAAQRDTLRRLLVEGLIVGNDASGNARFRAFHIAAGMAKDTHGLGAGIGASYRYYKDHGGFDYNFQESFNERMYGNEVIMSIWGQLLAEGGVVGVLLYLLAGIFQARDLWFAWRRNNSLLAYGSLAGCMVFFGFGALWLGNVCRGDVWVWFAAWSAFAAAGAREGKAA